MSDKAGVRDLAAEAKKVCKWKKTSFTRRYNTFQNLIKAKVQGSMLKEAYEVMGPMYKALDKSHEVYTDLVNEATIVAKGDYLEKNSLVIF